MQYRFGDLVAIVSMIAAIVGFIWVLPFVGSLAGAIMGHLSLGQIKRTGEGGRGMALTGVILGWIGVAIAVLIGTITLTRSGGGASMTADLAPNVPYGATAWALPAASNTVLVGGDLNVGANQQAGVYIGSFDLTVNYN